MSQIVDVSEMPTSPTSPVGITQKSFFTGLLVLLFSILIAENAVTDSFISSAIKQISTVVLCVASLIYVQRNIRHTEKVFFAVAFFCLSCACIGLFLRSLFFYDLSIFSVVRDLYHIFSCSAILLLVLASGVVQQDNSKNYLKIIFLFILSLAPLSFVLYLLSPSVTLSFFDNQGHFLQLTYYSLSSSLYRLESFQFARMSLIFDEPGTFGLFCSLLSSFLYLRQGRLTRTGSFVLIAGLSSVSLAYNLYVLAFLLVVVLLPEWSKRNAKKSFMSAGLAIVMFVVFILLLEQANDEFSQYIVSRMESVFSGNNNRTDGNALALKMLLDNPIGTTESEYGMRIISSSGVLVIAAYKGVLYAGAFLLIYSYFLFAILKKASFNFRAVIPLIIAVTFAILNRNNFFNVSGPVMLLAASYISSCFESSSTVFDKR